MALLLVALVLAVSVGAASADTIALDLNSSNATDGFNYTQGTYVMGFAFKATSSISITQLGYYDANLNNGPDSYNPSGVSDTFGSHAVGVYDLTSHTLLTSIAVDGSATATGFSRYVSISPLALNTTDLYAIVGISGSSHYLVGVKIVDVPVAPGISYQGSAYMDGNPAPQMSILAEPTKINPPGDIFGTTDPTVICDFGPNFQFEPTSSTVPVPAPFLLLGSGLLGLAGFRKKIKK
jgi:hypothetical protein